MQQIKTLILSTFAALTATVMVGAPSAMAESTTLCTGDGSGCGVAHVHETTLSGHQAAVLTSAFFVECDVLFLGDVTSANHLGSPLVISGGFTYSNCTSGCTITEENGPAELKLLKLGHETADVTEGLLIHVVCGATINCRYHGEAILGTAKGPLLSSETNGSISIVSQELKLEEPSTFLCEVKAFLDILTTPLSATYIAN